MKNPTQEMIEAAVDNMIRETTRETGQTLQVEVSEDDTQVRFTGWYSLRMLAIHAIEGAEAAR